MDEQAMAQMINDRVAQQIGQFIISITQQGVRAQADAMRIAELEGELAKAKEPPGEEKQAD